MEIPYPPIAPSMKWWPESAEDAPESVDVVLENAALRARVQALEEQLAAASVVSNGGVVTVD